MELGELPAGWASTSIGEVCSNLQYGYTASSSNEPNGPRFLRITDIQDGQVVWPSVPFCQIDGQQLDKYLLRSGDLVFARTGGTVGKSFLIGNLPEPAVFASYLIRLSPSKEVDPKYLYYFFQSTEYWEQIGLKKGGLQGNVNAKTLSSVEFCLSPLAEQHRIVAKIEELFSELDQGVASLKTAREQLKVYRQSLLKHAFEGKLTAAWRAAHRDQLETASTLQQRIARERQARYQQQLADWQTAGQAGPKPKPPKPLPPLTAEELAELPELPEGWVYSYLADMGDLGRGKSKHRPRNDPRLFGGSFPFIQTGEVKAANRVVRSYSQTYSEFGLAQSKLWPKGTLCITIAANIAQTAFLGFDGCFPDSVVGFTAFEPVVRAEYIDYFIQAARTRIEAYAPATAQKNINLETLENLVVPYCSRAEQEAVLCELESKLSEADQLDQTLATALQQADALRQSILKKAFCGQLVEQDKNDEPATALLERIRAARATSPARGRQAKLGSKPLPNC